MKVSKNEGWTVHATPPTDVSKWNFIEGYFPRTVNDKQWALLLAEEAKQGGATDVRVEKAK